MDTSDSDCNPEEERFTPRVRNCDDILTLAQAAACTPSPTPSQDCAPPVKKSGTLWSPVRRFLLRGMHKVSSYSRSPSQFSTSSLPLVIPERPTPCQSAPRSSSRTRCTSMADSEQDDDNCSSDEEEEICEQVPRYESTPECSLPPAPQFSGMCTPVKPSCQRNSCHRRPRRQRRPRNARHDICALQKSSNGSSKCIPKQRRPRRLRPQKSQQPTTRKQNKKKPPWMENYKVSPDIWEFLKNYRKEHPGQCLDDILRTSMGQYASGSSLESSGVQEEMQSDEDGCDSSGLAGTFREAASIARSMSDEQPPALLSIPMPSFVRAANPPPECRRACNDSCQYPNSVCQISMKIRTDEADEKEQEDEENCPRTETRNNDKADNCDPVGVCPQEEQNPASTCCSIQKPREQEENYEAPRPSNNVSACCRPPPPTTCNGNKDDVSAKLLN